MKTSPCLFRIAPILLGACVFIPVVHAQEAKDAPTVTTVYENDFNKEVDEKIWRYAKRKVAADGKGYLVIGTWMAGFQLGDLPEHQFVRARIRLAMIGSVDGSPVDGPTDYWTASLHNGPVLLRTSFQNPEDGKGRGVADGFGQSFPDEFPAGLNPAQTGTVAVNQHGLTRNGVYEFDLVFPHQKRGILIEFQEKLTERSGEGWHFLGFKLDVMSGPTPRTEQELDDLWKKLIGEDPMAAFEAVNEFLASGQPGTDYVIKRSKALAGNPKAYAEQEKALAAEIAKQVTALDSDSFGDVVDARSALKKLGVNAIPHLEKILKKKPGPKVTATLTKLIATMKKKASRPQGAEHLKGLIAARVARVLRISGESTRGLTISGSEHGYRGALVDGYGGDEESNHYQAPQHLISTAKLGGSGWVQYSYDEARTFDSADVYWLGSKEKDVKGGKMPESWSLSYLDGEEWKPIEPKGKYTATLGKWSHVDFPPITTSAIKLTVKSKPETDRTGLLEFRLNEVVRSKNDPKPGSAADPATERNPEPKPTAEEK